MNIEELTREILTLVGGRDNNRIQDLLAILCSANLKQTELALCPYLRDERRV
jgi:hypothetical protein